MFEESFMKLVKDKLSFDSSSNIVLNFEKRKILESQIATELKAVLRSHEDFMIDKSWLFLQKFVEKL